MTKEEALQKIAELKEYIRNIKPELKLEVYRLYLNRRGEQVFIYEKRSNENHEWPYYGVKPRNSKQMVMTSYRENGKVGIFTDCDDDLIEQV